MAGTVCFAVRGDSLTARYAPGGGAPGQVGTVSLVTTSGTGIIGSGYIDMSASYGSKGLYWPAGNGNFPTSNKVSMLFRVAIIGSNTLSNSLGGLGFVQQIGTLMAGFQSNTLYLDAEGLTGGDIGLLNNAFTPTLGRFYDVVYTFDMTSTSNPNAIQIYVDGVLLNWNNITAPAWGAGPRTNLNAYTINLGMCPAFINTRLQVNEFVIWDGIIDPTSGGLNLNGQSRSSFVACSSFDGTVNVDPGQANVRNGQAYTIAGVAKTGTLAVPTASQVLSGVAVDAGTGNVQLPAASDVKVGTTFGASGGSTGTYDGSDRWSDPGQANVWWSVPYKANSLTPNKVGTLVLPATADVRQGISYAVGTGVLVVPDPGDVRQGVSVDSDTGTLLVPDPADVRQGTAFDNTNAPQIGTLDLPAASNVKTGVQFDNHSKTGSYDGSDRWSNPGPANVRQGTAYKANSTTNNQTGSLDLPATSDVRAGVQYDGASKTGTFDAVCDYPAPADVRGGVVFDNGIKTGSLVVPAANKVREGTTFDNGTLGTLAVSSRADVGIDSSDDSVTIQD